MRKLLILFFSSLLLNSLVLSQDLVEVAKKEKERRARLKGKKAIVVTNHNLHKFRGREAIIVRSSGTVPGRISRIPPVSPAPRTYQPRKVSSVSVSELDRQEMFWREKKKEYEERWRKAKEYVDLLTLKMNGLWQEFYSLDDMTSRDKIQREISETYQKLLKAKEEEARAKKELENFLIEARKQGALPGWLREKD
ncbi:hypothetical protein NLC82_02985 [Candidatus Aminicenantes bacterium AC-335-A11]|jgi:hypothetical protein|nr:hypothetical protein [SCandidatus Aminicenantes bacterium Aminicenantia_JdfR_composite]MCP2596622.1 hypothetical protein [Candidatus Aminicenantes bacterium AC-335-G13]MCP2598052.1 hypothetical protein [Candidatus Aminicenantes bacterium AC-335-L06]MCP2606567.1 hypothetical protein [Candidatus Aminicenantes bacterium AC-708-I09]MCP2618364.1 hypothetical protein [Candidatus Aminicenantes bacterium AC-335-A11]